MADHPILFSAPMVRALLAGTKTQTRRVLGKGHVDIEIASEAAEDYELRGWHIFDLDDALCAAKLKYDFGDRLYVRETYYQIGHWEPIPGSVTRKGRRQKWGFVADRDTITFEQPADFRKGRHAADPATSCWHQRLGRFMPRKYSRLTLLVTDVRVQRLQDISERDARAEGINVEETLPHDVHRCWIDLGHDSGGAEWLTSWDAKDVYRQLWGEINGPGSWDRNPWVAAYSFTVSNRNIDTMEAAE